jgi:hypothetical protein
MTALAETAIAGVTVRELDIFIPKLPTSPYPGLRAFDKDEWPIFFGRERTTDELIEQLLQQQLIVVHGASGNGKSSLVRAGVQARLEQQHARFGLRWRTCVMRPGNAPLENLAAALAELTIDRADLPQIELRRALNHGQQSAETISRLLRLSGGDRVCIILDQFEELFRFAREGNRDQSSLLTDFLVGFQKSRPDGLFVLVTMRSEFLGECARFDGLAQTINRTQYLLPRMATTDLLRAVREPAALYGASVSERLAEQLVTEARDGQDELPLIQHGLSRLWQTAGSSDGAELIFDLPDYVSKGPLGRLLSDHADSIAERADENPDGQKIIEELFRALTDINADGVAIRRPQTFDELLAVTGTTDDRLRRILDAFCQPGVSFITPFKPAPIDRETTVDISHEALIRSWQRIADPQKGWLQREFRDGLIWRALVVQAESYAEDPQNLLSEATTEARSKWLQGRREGWARRYGGSWSRVQDLIEASKGEINRQKQKAKEDWQRAEDLRIERERARRRTVQTVASAIIAILMTGLAALTVWQRGIAIEAAQSEAEAKTAAEAARDAAEAARSRAEAAAQKEAQAKIAAEAAQTSSGVIAEALSSSSERDAAARLLNALDRTSDPYQIAVLGQSIAALPRRATDEELIRAAEVLARALAGTVDPSAASAIAQALTAVGQKLSTNGVHQALSPLRTILASLRDSLPQSAPWPQASAHDNKARLYGSYLKRSSAKPIQLSLVQ